MRLVDIDRVAEGTIEQRNVEPLDILATQQIIDRAVLHYQEDDRLDLVFEVGNRLL